MATNVSERQLDIIYLLMEIIIATNCLAKNAKPEYDKSLDLTTILQKIQRTEKHGGAMSLILIMENSRVSDLVS